MSVSRKKTKKEAKLAEPLLTASFLRRIEFFLAAANSTEFVIHSHDKKSAVNFPFAAWLKTAGKETQAAVAKIHKDNMAAARLDMKRNSDLNFKQELSILIYGKLPTLQRRLTPIPNSQEDETNLVSPTTGAIHVIQETMVSGSSKAIQQLNAAKAITAQKKLDEFFRRFPSITAAIKKNYRLLSDIEIQWKKDVAKQRAALIPNQSQPSLEIDIMLSQDDELTPLFSPASLSSQDSNASTQPLDSPEANASSAAAAATTTKEKKSPMKLRSGTKLQRQALSSSSSSSAAVLTKLKEKKPTITRAQAAVTAKVAKNLLKLLNLYFQHSSTEAKFCMGSDTTTAFSREIYGVISHANGKVFCDIIYGKDTKTKQVANSQMENIIKLLQDLPGEIDFLYPNNAYRLVLNRTDDTANNAMKQIFKSTNAANALQSSATATSSSSAYSKSGADGGTKRKKLR